MWEGHKTSLSTDLSTKPALEVIGLSKGFKASGRQLQAVQDVSFSIPPGQIVGLLGPNGAGKSTTLSIILGTLIPTQGKGFISGEPLGTRASRKSLGFLAEHVTLPPYYTPRELLISLAELENNKKSVESMVHDILGQCGFRSHADIRISSLSAGLKQRVGWAQALMTKPRLLILDEPTSNLDPEGRIDVKNWIQELHHNGSSILLSTHILSDVEAVAQRVLIMFEGKIVEDLDIGAQRKKVSLEETYMKVIGKARK